MRILVLKSKFKDSLSIENKKMRITHPKKSLIQLLRKKKTLRVKEKKITVI